MLGEAKAQFEAALRRLGKVKRPATGMTCAAGALITGGEVSEELVEDATLTPQTRVAIFDLVDLWTAGFIGPRMD